MANRFYDIECVDEGIFTVRKKKDNTVYNITKKDDGSWVHECKARSVYGNTYLCRHLKMIIGEFYTNKEFRHRFNITPRRENKDPQST